MKNIKYNIVLVFWLSIPHFNAFSQGVMSSNFASGALNGQIVNVYTPPPTSTDQMPILSAVSVDNVSVLASSTIDQQAQLGTGFIPNVDISDPYYPAFLYVNYTAPEQALLDTEFLKENAFNRIINEYKYQNDYYNICMNRLAILEFSCFSNYSKTNQTLEFRAGVRTTQPYSGYNPPVIENNSLLLKSVTFAAP